MLRAAQRLRLVESRKVTILDDIEPIDVGFSEISLRKGSEDEIPLWLGYFEQEKGSIKVSSLSLDELGRLLFQERQNVSTPASIVKSYPDLYLRIKDLRDQLKKGGIENFELVKKVQSSTNDLSSIRLRKVIQLALLNIVDQNVISKMTKEEYLVYLNVRKIITAFNGEVVGGTD
ncbi:MULTISPECIES: DNA replication complex GINS family protein [Acidianus]|nr:MULTISPECIES: DNA replication complex GINS family protein [Acidianus]